MSNDRKTPESDPVLRAIQLLQAEIKSTADEQRQQRKELDRLHTNGGKDTKTSFLYQDWWKPIAVMAVAGAFGSIVAQSWHMKDGHPHVVLEKVDKVHANSIGWAHEVAILQYRINQAEKRFEEYKIEHDREFPPKWLVDRVERLERKHEMNKEIRKQP